MSASFVLERLPAAARSDPAALATSKRQRVYILPTREGLIYCVLLFTMLLGAMNYNNSLAYILTFLLGSLFLVCMLHTHRNLAGLIISGSRPQPVFAGETAQFPVTIDNRYGPARTALNLVCHPRNRQGKRTAPEYTEVMVDVCANKKQVVHVPVPAARRGLLPLERITISSSFPLGLFRAWSNLILEQYCVVYPRPGGQAQLPPSLSGRQQGEEGAQDGANDFTGFRQYHPGDSIRTIAWKVLAREQALLVKRFSGDGSLTLLLKWEDVNHLHDIEARLSQLCRWLLEAERRGLIYGLILPGTDIEPSQGKLHNEACLEALAKYGKGHAGNG